MASWDPASAKEAAQYLRLDRKEMSKIQAQPFEGKKAVSELVVGVGVGVDVGVGVVS